MPSFGPLDIIKYYNIFNVKKYIYFLSSLKIFYPIFKYSFNLNILPKLNFETRPVDSDCYIRRFILSKVKRRNSKKVKCMLMYSAIRKYFVRFFNMLCFVYIWYLFIVYDLDYMIPLLGDPGRNSWNRANNDETLSSFEKKKCF